MYAEIDAENYDNSGSGAFGLWLLDWCGLNGKGLDERELRRHIRRIYKAKNGTVCHCPKCGKRFVKHDNMVSCEKHEKFIREFIENDKILKVEKGK